MKNPFRKTNPIRKLATRIRDYYVRRRITRMMDGYVKAILAGGFYAYKDHGSIPKKSFYADVALIAKDMTRHMLQEEKERNMWLRNIRKEGMKGKLEHISFPW